MRTLLRRILPAVLFATASPIFAEAPLANLVPEDAVVYVGWRGSDALGPQFEKSHLKGVIDAIELPKLIEAGIARTTVGADAHELANIKLFSKLGPAMLKYPAAVYFGGVSDFAPAKPTPKFAIFLKCGKEKADEFGPDLQKQIDTDPKRKPDDPKAKVETVGDFLLLTVGDGGDIKDRLTGKVNKAPLSENAEFKAAEAQTGAGALRVYVSGVHALKLADNFVDAKGPEQLQQMWPRFADGLGVDGIKSISLVGGFDGPNWSTELFVSIDEKNRFGLITLLNNPKLSDGALKLIPKASAFAGAFRISGEKIMKEIRDAAVRIGDDGQASVDRGLTRFTDFTGVDLEKDIITNFGDEFVYYSVPNAKGSALADITLVNKARNGATLEKALDNLSQIVGTFAGRGDAGFKLATENAGDLTIHVVSFKTGGGFAWAVKDNYWVLGLTSEAVQAAHIHIQKGGEDITANPAFGEMMAKFNQPNASSFTFCDLSKVAPESYAIFKENQLLERKGSPRESDPPPPDYEKIKPFFTVSGSVRWTDKAGFHLTGVSPFPMADLFSGEPSIMMKLQRSMLEARSRALASASERNLKSIGAGVAIYAADNGEKLPADLATLLKSQAISPTHLIRERTALPDDFRDMSTEEQSKWVLENSDYAFVGGGIMGNDAATRVIAYEKTPVRNLEKLHVLFADGHVEQLTKKDLDAKLK